MTTIGFIGLGNMGRPIADNIAAAGFDLVCFDAAGTAERLPVGARAMSGADEVFATADTVLISVPDGAIIRQLIDQLEAAPSRSVSVIIDLSTVGPAIARECAARLLPLGVTYCDGPVSGGVAGARAATISLMFGGPTAVLDAHRSIFDVIAGNVFHVGELAGQGQAMKLLNNYLSAVALAATSEAVAFGAAEGLDMNVMIDVLNVSTGRNSATYDKFPNRVMTGTYDAGFHTRLMTKDVKLFLQSIDEVGTAKVVATAIGNVWQAADEAMPGSDFTEIWKFVSGD
ncbi:MAG: 6-phosphogluconate dehydrogenase NAD-binding [Ilumatobacteraceae bacterium]|nr:6-phosphogluconate dehydrogenase NAD-binding [Ilumatobacteraceae bacterium]